MGIRTIAVAIGAILLCGSSASAFASPQLSIDPAGYQLVSKRRMSRVLFVYTYRATAVNNGSDAYGVTGTVSTAAAGLSMMDNALSFGAVPADGRVLSTDTFTVLQYRNARITAAAFGWNLASAPPITLTLGADQVNAFQDSTVTLRLTVTRAAGFTSDVTVSLDAPPDGISALPPTLPDGIGAAPLRIQISPAVTTGLMALSIAASATGVDPVTRPLSLTVGDAQPRSQELIQAALTAGTLDYGTSLLYRAYAWFGDARLPLEFIGSGSIEEDMGLIREIQAVLGTLSPTQEAELIPFTLRPSDPGSWYNRGAAPAAAAVATARGPHTRRVRAVSPQARAASAPATAAAAGPLICDGVPSTGAWVSVRSAVYPVRIWAQCADDSTQASTFADLYVQTYGRAAARIWAGMTDPAFMGPPLPDNTVNNFRQDIGDEAIDVYVTPQLGPNRPGGQISLGNSGGLSIPAAPPNSSDPRKKSGYILVPEDTVLPESLAQITLAHELMHVLQFAHNEPVIGGTLAGGFWWFADASAHWAAVHFDRTPNPPPGGRGAYEYVYKRSFENDFQLDPTVPLNDPGDHRYGAFIWPYFMEQKSGTPNIIGAAWRLVESATSEDEANQALNTLFPFLGNFRDFAKRNINSNRFEPGVLPLSDRYESLDPDQWHDNEEIGPRVYPSHVGPTVTHTDQIRTLAAQYWQFTFPDPNTRKVIIDLSGTHYGYPGLDLEALIKTDGNGWTSDLWNGKTTVVYCFDKPNERLEELWMVASNPLLTPQGGITMPIEFKVTVSDVPCQPAWVGTTTVTIDSADTYMEIESNVKWLFDEAGTFIPLQPNFYSTGSVTITHWIDKRCGLDYLYSPHSGTMTSYQDGPDGVMSIDYEATPPTVYFSGATSWVGRITEVCDQDNPITLDPYPFIATWVIPFAPVPTVSADGTTIEGTQIINAETTQTFKFTRQDQ